jgi:hypothetical protein
VNSTGAPIVLIQWSNAFSEDATWELLSEIKEQFPELHLEDKVYVEEERDVTDHHQAQELGVNTRPKRIVKLPYWLRGFAT